MEITEVKVRLVEDKTERLRAFCTVTLDREFVVRDIKVIDGAKGLFVAMPSRKLTDHCPKCGAKNHLRAKFCNECGTRLPGRRVAETEGGSSKLHVDVAHPINSECRARFQKAILEAYRQESERAKRPDYVPPRLEVGEREAASSQEKEPAESPRREEPPPESEKPGSDDEKPFGAGLI